MHNIIIIPLNLSRMPTSKSLQFYMELPSAMDDVLAQWTVWLSPRGRMCRLQTQEGVHRVRFEMNTQSRQDTLKLAFSRYYKRPIEPFVLRMPRARDMAAVEATPIPEEPAQVAEAGDARVVALAKLVDELSVKVAHLQGSSTPVTLNGNVQINIHINTFGQEAMDHLRAPEVYRRFQTFDGVRHVLNETYFNPAVPENHNVKSRSVKQNMVEVRVGDGWEVRPFAEIANRMIDIGIGYAYRDFKVTQDNADAPETTGIMELMRKTFHPRLRDGIRAALVTRKDREKRAPVAARM